MQQTYRQGMRLEQLRDGAATIAGLLNLAWLVVLLDSGERVEDALPVAIAGLVVAGFALGLHVATRRQRA